MGGQMAVAYVFAGLLAISPVVGVVLGVPLIGIVTLIARAMGAQ
jgi:hypothetical protein